MSILCRLGWHAWRSWIDGWHVVVAIDHAAWGRHRFVRACSRCGRQDGRDMRP